MKKMLIATVLAVGSILAMAPAALAVDYPAGPVPPSSGEPGAKLNFSVQTGYSETEGTVDVEGDDVTDDIVTAAAVTHTITTTTDGFAKFGVLLPETAEPGSTYDITVKVADFTKTLSIDVADAQLETEALPTGEETADPEATSAGGVDPSVFWFGGGAVALVAALIAVIAVRRSRTTPTE